MSRRSYVGGLVVLACVALWGLGQLYFWFLASPKEEAPVSFTVEEGESFRSVADRLAEDDIIRSSWSFRLFERMRGGGEEIKAGEHQLNKGDRYTRTLAHLANASAVDIAVTIPEGFTIAQIGARVERLLGITPEDWQRASEGMEGRLFPDTYAFQKSATAEDIVTRMRKAYEDRIAAIGAPTGRASNYTPDQMLVLASILEREVRNKEDMRQVADIFYKRLAIGMALQSDATINYILDTGLSGVTLAHTKVDHPYNTYQYPGLPPGPISNPGMNALDAAHHPAENPYYYFLTDAAGKVYYGKTNDEHIQNKIRAGL